MCTSNTHYTRMAFGDSVVNMGFGKRWVLEPQSEGQCGALVMTPVEDVNIPVGAPMKSSEATQADTLTVLHFATTENVDVMIDALVMLRDKMKAKAEPTTAMPQEQAMVLAAAMMKDPVAMLEMLFPPVTPQNNPLVDFLNAQAKKGKDTADAAMLADLRKVFGEGIL